MTTRSLHRLRFRFLFLLTGRRASPATVLLSSASSAAAAAPPVHDGPLGVVGHRVVDGADVGEELKVIKDVSRQFGLISK